MPQNFISKRQLRCTTVVQDDLEEEVIWEIVENEGAIVINLVKNTGLEISECYWVDESRTYLQAKYSHWTSMELFALIDQNGSIVAKSISEVAEYIVDKDLFIVVFSGHDTTDQFFGEILDNDDLKYAVVNGYGELVIPMQDWVIRYLEEGRVFVCEQRGGDSKVYDLKGRVID
jgi:hypothetical protein